MTYNDGVINEDDRKQRQSRGVVNMYTLGTEPIAQTYKMPLGYVKMFSKHAFFCKVVSKRVGKL